MEFQCFLKHKWSCKKDTRHVLCLSLSPPGLFNLSAVFKGAERSSCDWSLLKFAPPPPADSVFLLRIIYLASSISLCAASGLRCCWWSHVKQLVTPMCVFAPSFRTTGLERANSQKDCAAFSAAKPAKYHKKKPCDSQSARKGWSETSANSHTQLEWQLLASSDNIGIYLYTVQIVKPPEAHLWYRVI